MNIKSFNRGIQILLPYYDNLETRFISCEHGRFWIDPTDRPLTEKDVYDLRFFDWFQEDERLYGYNQNLGWGCFA